MNLCDYIDYVLYILLNPFPYNCYLHLSTLCTYIRTHIYICICMHIYIYAYIHIVFFVNCPIDSVTQYSSFH